MKPYDSYFRNFNDLISLFRVRADIEKSQMRNCQWVSAWAFEKGKKDKVIKIICDGKTYFNITNYESHDLFGQFYLKYH
jgi:dipeptidyl-peptidase-3